MWPAFIIGALFSRIMNLKQNFEMNVKLAKFVHAMVRDVSIHVSRLLNELYHRTTCSELASLNF